MKRTLALLLATLAAVALFVGLVHAVLTAAQLSEPAATTVHGPTLRRLWATMAAGLALLGVVIAGLALLSHPAAARPASRFGPVSRQLSAIVALVMGLMAAANGGLLLAAANGGLGYLMVVASGNLDVPLVFAGLLLLAAMGVVFYFVAALFERRMTAWAYRGME